MYNLQFGYFCPITLKALVNKHTTNNYYIFVTIKTSFGCNR